MQVNQEMRVEFDVMKTRGICKHISGLMVKLWFFKLLFRYN